MSLEKLPEGVPEVGTIVKLTVKDKDAEPGRFYNGRLSHDKSYRAKVVSVSEGSENPTVYHIEIEGLTETVLFSVDRYSWLMLSQVNVNLDF